MATGGTQVTYEVPADGVVISLVRMQPVDVEVADHMCGSPNNRVNACAMQACCLGIKSSSTQIQQLHFNQHANCA
jgi:hypothetical protein